MSPDILDIAMPLITSLITGGVAMAGTVKALGVHIAYINAQLARQEQAIERAHQRMDSVEISCKFGQKGVI